MASTATGAGSAKAGVQSKNQGSSSHRMRHGPRVGLFLPGLLRQARRAGREGLGRLLGFLLLAIALLLALGHGGSPWRTAIMACFSNLYGQVGNIAKRCGNFAQHALGPLVELLR